MIRTIVFDMGGVLYHFYPEKALAALPDGDRDLVEKAVYASPDWVLQDRGDIDEGEMIRRARSHVPERLRDTAEQFVRWYELMGPVEGMAELARELKSAGYPLYLLSNVGEAYRRFRERIPAAAYLTGEFLSSDYGLLKPNREIFEKFLAVYGLEAGECLFVDDTARNIDGARSAGMHGIVFRGDALELREKMKEMGVKFR